MLGDVAIPAATRTHCLPTSASSRTTSPHAAERGDRRGGLRHVDGLDADRRSLALAGARFKKFIDSTWVEALDLTETNEWKPVLATQPMYLGRRTVEQLRHRSAVDPLWFRSLGSSVLREHFSHCAFDERLKPMFSLLEQPAKRLAERIDCRGRCTAPRGPTRSHAAPRGPDALESSNKSSPC